MKNLVVILCAAIAASGSAQTKPIQPQTPNVKLPGDLKLPAPDQIALGQQPLSVEEAVQIALKNQPLIGIAQGNLRSARGRTEQSASNLLPNFVANGGYTKTQAFRTAAGASSSTGNLYSTGVSVDQLLFDFGRTRDSVRQEEALERAASHSLTRTQQTVALTVRQDFYALIQDLAEVDVQVANVANRQRQLDEAQARLDSGLGAPGDVVSAKTGLASAAGSLSSARDTALAARIFLAQDLGVDPRTPITPAASKEPAIPEENDLQALVGVAMKNRPDILAAREQVVAARYGISAAQKGNLPTFSASIGVGTRGPNDPLATSNGTFSINVTWNFANSGFTAGAVESAKGNEEVARSNLQDVTQQAVTDVGQAFVDLQSALQRVDLANVEVANAKEYVRITEGRYTGGLGAFSDITIAQGSLVTAQRDLIQAQQDVQTVRARLRTATGRL